jgi:hypothetical protein
MNAMSSFSRVGEFQQMPVNVHHGSQCHPAAIPNNRSSPITTFQARKCLHNSLLTQLAPFMSEYCIDPTLTA